MNTRALRGGKLVSVVALTVGLTVGLLGTGVVRPAGAQTASPSQVMSLLNSTRASVGLPAVGTDGLLSAVAQTWAGVMAAAGTISHNPALTVQIGNWSALAENVGMGSSIEQVHQALVNSPVHYANMTDSRFTLAGAGVVASGGEVFVVQVFMQPRDSAPPTYEPPAPEPEPEPEPEPQYWAPAPPPAPEAEEQAAPEIAFAPAEPDPVSTAAATPEPVLAVPAAPVEVSVWMRSVLEQLRALDGTL